MPIPSPPKGPERDLRAFVRYAADRPRGPLMLIALSALVVFGPSLLGGRFGFVGSMVGFIVGVVIVSTFWIIVLRSGKPPQS
ncbi:hypothetical protein [Nocardioides albertanoniae]|uniref:hypothetical protein n=1 Tax=Nocardioides albertanoniae TaxID=1175486 RepID=UPI0011535E22|nr:hypothetical protein [Nocardioides albertanoniae]